MLARVDVARRLDLLQKVDESVQELLHEGGPERAHLDADLQLGRLDLDGGEEVLPVGPLLGGVAGEVAVEVHDQEEGVHRDVGVGVAALADEALDGMQTPDDKSNYLI